jgi:hypothetical protein
MTKVSPVLNSGKKTSMSFPSASMCERVIDVAETCDALFQNKCPVVGTPLV